MLAEERLTIPVGTQVVTRAALTSPTGTPLYPIGAVGVIVALPEGDDQTYRVRFPDGGEADVLRRNLAVRKSARRDELRRAGATGERDLYEYVIYRCIVGSRAYGLDDEGSDWDCRGIYLPPAALHWSLYGVPEQLESRETEETYWELQKFLILALKANPNVLECLYTPLVEHATVLAQELLNMRDVFLSRLVYQTYNGYVMSQFKKLEIDLRTTGAPRWKHAMHLIRLLLSGTAILREGAVPVRVMEHRERLLAIKRGETPWAEVDRWRLALHRAFDAAYTATKLPERPDYDKVNAFLVEARRSMVEG